MTKRLLHLGLTSTIGSIVAALSVAAGPTSAIAQEFETFDSGALDISAATRLDFGGGYKMGSLISKLDPTLTGGRNSGLITSRFEPITFANGRGNLAFYGRFNNGLLNVDNGNPDRDKTTFSTNGAQVNVIGARIRYEWSNDLSFGVRGALSGAFNRSDILNDFSDGDAGCDERHLDRTVCAYAASFFVKSQTFGKISIGLGEAAAAGVGDVNLGGITYVTNSSPTVKGGWNEVWKLGRRLNDIAPDTEGITRASRIRYDSPTVAGFVLSASFGEADYTGAPADAQDYWDTALRYAGEFGAIRVAAAASVQNYDRRGHKLDQTNVTGGASIMHTPTGIYLTGSATGLNRDAPFDAGPDETDSASAYYLQAGISQDYFGIGNTVLYGEYGQTENGANAGAYYWEDSKTTNWGVGIAQNIDAAAMSVYLTYNQIEAEFDGVKGEDMNVVFAGARIKF
ncbi:hypothetical protein [Bauldia sp.]|uniref:hypothetical protein n=1 Tax=Bauldia sp. TaxID=2575872 RepID=UPI003BAD5664